MSTPWVPQNKLPQFGANNWLPGALVAAGAIVVFLMIVFSTYFTIDQGERGVILHNGAIAGEAEPGLHFKMPIITSIAKISVQIQKDAFERSAEGDARMHSLLSGSCSGGSKGHMTYIRTDSGLRTLADGSSHNTPYSLEDRARHSTVAGKEGSEGTPALFNAITV